MDVAATRHVAALAQLSLTPDEERELAADLDRILAFVAELEAVDTRGVPPMTHANLADAARWRADEIAPGLTREAALSGAPRTTDGAFDVPSPGG